MESTLLHNDEIREEERVRMNASREEERVCMTHNSIIILSGNEYDSGRREITFRPVTSFNKASTFTDEHKSDNEETPLGKTHQVPFT